jgi:hypothetical protein
MNLSIFDQKQKRTFVLLIVFTFLLKISLAAYFSYLGDCNNPELSIGYLAKASGDTFSYLGSIENYLAEGTYYFWNGVRKVYAGRMPYYGTPYYLFRVFFDKPFASDLLVLVQIFFDTLATVYFARLCSSVLKHQSAFWIGYALYLLSFNYFETTLLLSTESFALSFIVLFYYAFHRWWSGENKSSIWTANIFLTLCFLLKPYFAPTYLLFLFIYAYRENLLSPDKFKTLFIKAVLLGLPLFLMLSPWFLRNVFFVGQPVATQESYLAGYNYTKADLAVAKFSSGWGGDIAWWDSASPACYFKIDPPFPCTFSFPSYSLTDGYSLQDIEDARADYFAYQRNPSPELEEIVIEKFDKLTTIHRSERPFTYYMGSSFVRVKRMLWHTSNYNLPIHPSGACFEPFQLSFKVVQSIIYQVGLSLGLIGIIWLTFKKKVSLIFLFAPISVGFLIAFYFRFSEARYLSHGYPVILLGLMPVWFLVYSTIKKLILGKRANSYNKLD